MWNSALTTRHPENHIWLVEANGGEVVGFAAGGPEREEGSGQVGEIYAIYLLKEHHGRGWGRQLFTELARRLRHEGYESIVLWVLADNPTRGFYEAMGGTLSKEKDIEIGGDTLVEVAYEWARIDDLAG